VLIGYCRRAGDGGIEDENENGETTPLLNS